MSIHSNSFRPMRTARVSSLDGVSRNINHSRRLVALRVDGLIASAGNSTIILLHLFDNDPTTTPSSEPVDGLIGHHANICALSYSRRHKQLISASWDCAARVWSRSVKGKEGEGKVKSKAGEWECRCVLSGHEAAVWGVTILEGGPHDGFFFSGQYPSVIWMTFLSNANVSSRLGGQDTQNVRHQGRSYPLV
jgi:WD40 repeat protein